MSDVVVQSSPIHGVGIFASRAISRGNRITKLSVVREITPEAPIREDLGERIDHCAYPDGKVLLIGYPERHVNHSCDPNAFESFQDDGCYLMARRDIAADEEITIDYNVNITNGSTWPCQCGAMRCNGIVAGDFFELPLDRQREYRPLLADWFIRQHGDRVVALDSLRAAQFEGET